MSLTDCLCGVCSEVGPADLNNFTCLAENSIGRAQAVVQVSGMSGILPTGMLSTTGMSGIVNQLHLPSGVPTFCSKVERSLVIW